MGKIIKDKAFIEYCFNSWMKKQDSKKFLKFFREFTTMVLDWDERFHLHAFLKMSMKSVANWKDKTKIKSPHAAFTRSYKHNHRKW
jgi:hypothetical protein